MTGEVLLDTNIDIGLFAAEPAVMKAIQAATRVYVPAIVLGELYYGAQKSARVTVNLARVDEFASKCNVLECDAETARHYGTVKALLKAKGRPIPENDVGIAALAVQHDCTVLTRDAHFQEVDGLRIDSC